MNLLLGNFIISLVLFLTTFIQGYLYESYFIGIVMATCLAVNIIMLRLFMAMHENTDGDVFLETKYSNLMGALFMVINVLTVEYINLTNPPELSVFASLGFFICLGKMTDFGLHGITMGTESVEILMVDKYSFNIYHAITCITYIVTCTTSTYSFNIPRAVLVILPFLYFFRLIPDLTLIPLVLAEKFHIHILGGSSCFNKTRLLREFLLGFLLLATSCCIGYYASSSVGAALISIFSPILASDPMQYYSFSARDVWKKPPTIILFIQISCSCVLISDTIMSQFTVPIIFSVMNLVVLGFALFDLIVISPSILMFVQRHAPQTIRLISKNISNLIYNVNSLVLTFYITITWSVNLKEALSTPTYLLLFIAGAKLIRQAWTLPSSLLHACMIYVAYLWFNSITNYPLPFIKLEYSTFVLFVCAIGYQILKRYLDNLLNIIRFSRTYVLHGYHTENKVSFQLFLIILSLPWNLFLGLFCAVFDVIFCPLLGLPLFWIDVARSSKFFWKTDEEDLRNVDSAMYSNFSKLFKQNIHKNYMRKLTGTEGNNCLLIRNEYLSYFVQTLEVGFGYAVFQFKGLELEPTSCHNREILHADECIKKQSVLSYSLFDIFRPIGTAELMTMELCFIRLNGYNSHEFLVKFLKNFNASLIWVFSNLKGFSLGEYVNSPPTSFLYTPPYSFESQMGENGFAVSETFKNLFYSIVNSYSEELKPYQDAPLDFWLPDLYDGEIITDFVDNFSRTTRSIDKPVCLALKYGIICTIEQLMNFTDVVDYYTEFVKYQNTFFLHLRVADDVIEWYKATNVIPKEVYCLSKKMYNFGLDESLSNSSALLILKRKISDVDVIQINTSTVKSIWSNLLFEVGYRGTSDEERYSLQAEPHLLRNTLNQIAHYPYGWASFSSVFKINLENTYK
eukprot:NODE_39_length_29903_cov_0.529057.p1 type:complete len:909 gc:universal NODE_39_length_29903_cov_0.529057:20673-17947(-)